MPELCKGAREGAFCGACFCVSVQELSSMHRQERESWCVLVACSMKEEAHSGEPMGCPNRRVPVVVLESSCGHLPLSRVSMFVLVGLMKMPRGRPKLEKK